MRRAAQEDNFSHSSCPHTVRRLIGFIRQCISQMSTLHKHSERGNGGRGERGKERGERDEEREMRRGWRESRERQTQTQTQTQRLTD